MIHLKFDLNQIKISKSFDFSKKNECKRLSYDHSQSRKWVLNQNYSDHY